MEKSFVACRICGSEDVNHKEHDHPFKLAEMGGDHPVAFVIDMQRFHDDDHKKAAVMALVRKEMAQYFPRRTFEIMPSSFVSTRYSQNSLNEKAHVTHYIAYEI